jgi:hypothetical protein
MRKYQIIALLILVAAISISACTTQKILCEPPNAVIDNTCCLDTNKNNVCDSKEDLTTSETQDSEEEETQESATTTTQTAAQTADAKKEFANAFAKAWELEKFDQLYDMFTNDLRDKMSKEEFVWLANKKNAQLKLEEVNVYKVSGDTIDYDLIGDDPSIKNSARGSIVLSAGKYYHRPFNYFKTLSAADVCEDNPQCVVDYARKFERPDLCEQAGSLRINCMELFGAKFTFEDERETCNSIPDYMDRADCIQSISIKYVKEDACWDLTEDPQLFKCLGHVAGVKKNPQLCWDYMANFTFVNDKLKHAYCIYGYVEETKDYTQCKEMSHGGSVLIGSMEEECYHL